MTRRLDSRPRVPAGIGAPAVAALLALILAPAPGHAQTRGEQGIRVIETVDPVSGARYRQALYDLSKMEIKTVQRALREAGYLGVGWTGQLDHGTIRALNELQEEKGLYQCGCVSYETIVALGLKPAVEVTTVAVGSTSASAYGTDDPDRYGYHSGILYPVAVPILVPPAPEDPDDPDEQPPAGAAPASAPTFPPSGATPPGVRPLPPPTRIYP